MKKNLMFCAVLAASFAAPCAAQLTDDASALAAFKSNSAKDRLGAISYFGAQRTQSAYEALASQFQTEKDAYLRVRIVEALDVQGSTWAYSCASAAAADTNRAVRQEAAVALAANAGDPATEQKLRVLAADPEPGVRMALLQGLSVNTSTTSVSIIGGVLGDHNGPLSSRRAAARVLSAMKTKAADDMLLRYLSDSDPQIEAAAMSRRPASAEAPRE
jgi:HEAT repeat protein